MQVQLINGLVSEKGHFGRIFQQGPFDSLGRRERLGTQGAPKPFIRLPREGGDPDHFARLWPTHWVPAFAGKAVERVRGRRGKVMGEEAPLNRPHQIAYGLFAAIEAGLTDRFKAQFFMKRIRCQIRRVGIDFADYARVPGLGGGFKQGSIELAR